MLRNIGEMRHRITIQRPLDMEPGEKGYPAEAWEDFAKVWAYREDISGKEFYGAAAVSMEETVTFTIHSRKGLDTSMRILHGDEIFEVTHISGGRNVGDRLIIRTVRKERENAERRNSNGGNEG